MCEPSEIFIECGARSYQRNPLNKWRPFVCILEAGHYGPHYAHQQAWTNFQYRSTGGIVPRAKKNRRRRSWYLVKDKS